jgi:hypothetical protein
MDLSLHEAVGIALAIDGAPDNQITYSLPWDRLHGYGYVKTVCDFTGEATTIATAAGREALSLALSRQEPS